MTVPPPSLPQSVADLVSAADAGIAHDFTFFWGHRSRRDGVLGPSVLSQWYPAPFAVDGIIYPTAEHYMMAEKARLFGDSAVLAEILATEDPRGAKALGRRVMHFDEARWNDAAFATVVRGNAAKFTQNESLGAVLRDTGTSVIVEASPVDTVWGIGLAADDPRATDPRQWNGSNLLGFALMAVRATLSPRGH